MSKKIEGIVSHWLKPIYLYAVSGISLIVFIIGTVTIVNLLIREYIFDIHGSWYQDPESSCEYIYTGDAQPDTVARFPVPKSVSTSTISAMTREEKDAVYTDCLQREQQKIERQADYNFADSMSRGIAMILVSVPLFALHWKMAQRMRG